MKSRRYYFMSAVVVAVLCTCVFGEIGAVGRIRRASRRANPALAGIEQLAIAIVPTDVDPNADDELRFKRLRVKIEQKITEAGLRIYSGPVMAGLRPAEIAELRVGIDMLMFESSGEYVYFIRTSLLRQVEFKSREGLLSSSAIWAMGGTTGAKSVRGKSAAVSNLAVEQVEAFVAAWLGANPQKARAYKGGRAAAVSATALKREAELIAKSQADKYQYVSSRKSKVFHKSDCSSVRRIKPENLMGYSSRDEVVKAGKRPCKRCNP